MATGFVPEEDQGVCITTYQLNPGASLEQAKIVSNQIDDVVSKIKVVKYMSSVTGYNIITAAKNPSAGAKFVSFLPWEERDPATEDTDHIIQMILEGTAHITDARIFAFNIPAIPGLGVVGGFDFRVQDYLSGDLTQFMSYVDQIMDEARKDPRIGGVYTSFDPSYPMYNVDFNREKINAMGVDMADLLTTMQTYLGSYYINDFNKFGKVFKVYAQADVKFRSNKADVSNLYVKNNKNEMVPISALVSLTDIKGPQMVTHYQLYRSIQINGNPAAGYSSGDAMDAMEEIAHRVLPKQYGFEWSGMSLQERESSSSTAMTFIFVIISYELYQKY